jgi:hypothetical protein
LSNDDRTGSDQEDLVDIGAAGHEKPGFAEGTEMVDAPPFKNRRP